MSGQPPQSPGTSQKTGPVADPEDVENIRAQLLEEAEAAIEPYKERPDILAMILTGSAAWGKVTRRSDIDILFITTEGDGVFYQYRLPRYTGLPRQTEFGHFPLWFVEKKLETGHDDVIGLRLIEQLRNGRVLFERDGAGTRIVERAKAVKPTRWLVGNFLSGIKNTHRAARALQDAGMHRGAIQAARAAANQAAQVLLLVRDRTSCPKHKHEWRAIQRLATPEERACYRAIMGCADVAPAEGEAVVRCAEKLLSQIYEMAGMDPGFAYQD